MASWPILGVLWGDLPTGKRINPHTVFRFLPNVLLKQLYTRNSLRNIPGGFTFSLKNRLSDARFTGLERARVDGHEYPADAFVLETDAGEVVAVADISLHQPLPFPLRRSVRVRTTAPPLLPGRHTLEVTLNTHPFGTITVTVEDELQPDEPTPQPSEQPAIPRDNVE